MPGTRLPAVRIPEVSPGQGGEEDGVIQDPVIADLAPSNKFGFAWPAEQPGSVPITFATERSVNLSSSEGETDVSEEEMHAPRRRQSRHEDSEDSEFTTPTNHLASEQNPMDSIRLAPQVPRLSRAFSMPLPSQLGSLQHPRRPSIRPTASPLQEPIGEPEQFRELSLELADSVQMVIQTLLQLSPPQVLDPVKEQFSACSLSIPTPSIAAMFTSMKNLNYMSANMSVFSDGAGSDLPSKADAQTLLSEQNDFDVGELLQSVGDALSGVAAQAGVDLVLFHGDIGMKHISVKGDENGLSYTLSHVIRQIIGTCEEDDTIEVGLFIEAFRQGEPVSAGEPTSRLPSPSDDTSFRCNFLITHKFSNGVSTPGESSLGEEDGVKDSLRPAPTFESLILRRLLQHIGASLTAESEGPGGRSYEMSVLFEPGEPSAVNPTTAVAPEDAAVLGFPDMQIANEPSLEELVQFAETLRGRSVTLHASPKGSFAHHLSSYLTAWGMSVSHMSTELDADGEYELVGEATEQVPPIPSIDLSSPSVTETSPSTSPHAPRRISGDPAFILIDDDVAVLRSRLQKIRVEQAYPLSLHGRKRPSLASHHRPRSSPQVARVVGLSNTTNPTIAPQVVIVHFTSLCNFKLVKDAIQSILAPSQGSALRIPEVIVIPKPAGPRRFLTALHTAVTRPVVDPFFVPTATSPMSPGIHAMNPFFSYGGGPKSPGGRSSTSGRTNSEKSTKSPRDYVDGPSSYAAPPSPLGHSDNMEYFSDAANKFGGSPATGLLIQSPDGQPTGIFFHPKARSGNGTPSPNMERDRPHSSRVDPDGSMRPRRIPSGGDGGSKTNSFIVSPPVRPVSRLMTAASEPTEASSAAASKGKQKATPSPFSSEENHPKSIEQNLASSSSVSPDPAPQRYLARRSSQQSNPTANSPPPSPQLQAPNKITSTRKTRRPTVESHASAPAAGGKKGKGGPESNIVPPISVLIVDDNPINQTILSTFMKKKRIKYDVAKNGEEAVHKWRSGLFHLILMDIQMPIMDGIQATKEIRRIEKVSGTGGFPSTPQSEGQRTPSEASTTDSRNISTPPYRSSVIIVALTASSLQQDRVAALAAGCNDFLTKPVSLEWLNSKIIEWGSIKALQMWADIRPEVVKSISSEQNAQAQQVARRLHVPEGRSSTPSSERARANRRASVDTSVERSQNLLSAGDGSSSIEPRSALSGMTASEAAIGLAAAHRPALPVDGLRIPVEVAQAAVIPPPPELVVASSETAPTSMATTVPPEEPPAPAPAPALTPAENEKEEPALPATEDSVNNPPPPPPPQ
ncbi:hypothetical protein BDW22DRAFT_527311 [Trametopsis cervina]|nr:hypothetical protein BDW22DRAFT_527311 [Trametopsis cervina]